MLSSSTKLTDYLKHVSERLKDGTGKVRQGALLGFALPRDMQRLGFEKRLTLRGFVWERPFKLPKGVQAIERYTTHELAELERMRHRLIHIAADQEIPIMINVLSSTAPPNAGEHPVRGILAVRYDAKVAIEMFDPPISKDIFEKELQLASRSVSGVPFEARLYFASYHGRERLNHLTRAKKLREYTRDRYINRTTPEQRPEILRELKIHFRYGETPLEPEMDSEHFGEALDTFLRQVFY